MRKRCSHGRTRYCKICHPGQLCAHSKANGCRICHPHQFCKHEKRTRRCRICNPLSWAKFNLDSAVRRAKRFKYTAPVITASQIVELSKNTTHCVGCGQTLDWTDTQKVHLHHDHKTGEVGGFLHEYCNRLEGALTKFGIKRLKVLLRQFFVEVYET
jgi:hypothetical protein